VDRRWADCARAPAVRVGAASSWSLLERQGGTEGGPPVDSQRAVCVTAASDLFGSAAGSRRYCAGSRGMARRARTSDHVGELCRESAPGGEDSRSKIWGRVRRVSAKYRVPGARCLVRQQRLVAMARTDVLSSHSGLFLYSSRIPRLAPWAALFRCFAAKSADSTRISLICFPSLVRVSFRFRVDPEKL
jgi:hypothetical protein